MSNELLEAALLYADKGLAVLPLRGKVPIFDDWPNLATKDKNRIERWWKQNPNANVGIATGRKSSVIVVDVDPRHGGDRSWEEVRLQHPEPLDTWQDITGGGGNHVYLRQPNFPVKNLVGLLPGIDIRGDGGQVVAPPSIHPDTHRRYEWDGIKPIAEQPIADAPIWLLELLQTKSQSKPFEEITLEIPQGKRHQVLLSMAGMQRRLGLNEQEIYVLLMEVNRTRCNPPESEPAIRQLAHSMMKYPPGDKNLYLIATRPWVLAREAEIQNQTLDAHTQYISARDLLKNPVDEPGMVVDECLHTGCTILAGPPKSGKSWLTLGLAISVATGGKFLGAREVCRAGKVGYFALEESRRRTTSRLNQLTTNEDIRLDNIQFLYSLRPPAQGGLQDLAHYCEREHPDLIIIDTLLAFFTGDNNIRRDVFRDDYREIKSLADLAHKCDLSILVVHHTAKIGGELVSAVAGTHGLTAAADAIWRLQRQPHSRALLEMTGREIEEQAFLIELDLKHPVGWNAIEQGDDVILSGERQLILEVLRESGPKTPLQISREIGQKNPTTRKLLQRMLEKGLIIRTTNGSYHIPKVQKPSDWHEKD